MANRVRFRNWSRMVATPLWVFPHAGNLPRRLVFHPGGRHLMTLTAGNRCALWDLERGERLELPGGERAVTSFAWNPDGNRLALGTPEGDVALHDFPRGVELGSTKLDVRPWAAGARGPASVTRRRSGLDRAATRTIPTPLEGNGDPFT